MKKILKILGYIFLVIFIIGLAIKILAIIRPLIIIGAIGLGGYSIYQLFINKELEDKSRFKNYAIISVVVLVITMIFIPSNKYLKEQESIREAEKAEEERIRKEETLKRELKAKEEKEKKEKLEKTYPEAKVTRIVDGDTIEILIEDQTYKVRFIGVNTPETKDTRKEVEYLGKEASDYTSSQLINKTIYLEKDVSDTDKYNRLLRYIWLERPENEEATEEEIKANMFNAILVKEGYAYSTAYPPDLKYQEIFEKLQKEAEETNLGLWNQEAEEQFEQEKIEQEQATTTTNPDGTVIGITSTQEITSGGRTYTADTTPNVIKGNANSMIYHSPGQRDYNKISVNNVVHFATAEDAENAGYKPAER